MRFYFKRGILSLVLGLTAVMVIYWVGVPRAASSRSASASGRTMNPRLIRFSGCCRTFCGAVPEHRPYGANLKWTDDPELVIEGRG